MFEFMFSISVCNLTDASLLDHSWLVSDVDVHCVLQAREATAHMRQSGGAACSQMEGMCPLTTA